MDIFSKKQLSVLSIYIVVLDSGEDGLIPAASGVFVSAGSKKLQQSSNYLPEEEGVKFLPVMR